MGKQSTLPAALAHDIVNRLWPPGIKRDTTRAEVEWALADAIAATRRADARICNRIGLDGGDTHTAHVAVQCRDAIRAQNRRPK